jgi:hypothetical protein
MSNIIIEGIEEADLRVAIWMRNQNKTKKALCEYLKIKYNTTRLDKILNSFEEALLREEELRKLNKKKVFTDEEEKVIAKRYIEVGSMSKVADEYYISAAKIKKILINQQIPIKSRKTILVDHIEQDLDKAFSIGDFAFSKIHKSKCQIVKKYDEEYIDYLKNGSIKTVDNPYIEDGDKENINFSVYWVLEDGTNVGLLPSVESLIKNIETTLIKVGQEFYRVKVQNVDGDDYYGFCKRGDLY